MSAAPSVSVVVACQNPGSSLSEALKSVWAQRWCEPELIVVDAGSTDGTRDWLAAQRSRLATLILAAGPSPCAARNQGLAAAHGEWVLFLDPDDRLVGDAVLSEALIWMKKTEAGVAAGEAAYDDGRIEKLRGHPNSVAGNFSPAPATFYRRALFEENGGFDVSLAFTSFYELHVRLWKNRVRFKPIPLRIAACGTRLSRAARRWEGCREEIAVRHRYFSPARCALWDALTVLRWARGKTARTLLGRT